MSRRKLLILIIVCAVAGAALALWALDARVDRLTLAMRIGISAGPATAEAERLYDDWWRWINISNTVTGLTFWLIIVSGLPLAIVAVIAANWPKAIGPLARSETALRTCLTLQSMNLGLPVMVMLMVAFMFDETAITVLLVSAVYLAVNFVAVRVWRDQLLQVDARK